MQCFRQLGVELRQRRFELWCVQLAHFVLVRLPENFHQNGSDSRGIHGVVRVGREFSDDFHRVGVCGDDFLGGGGREHALACGDERGVDLVLLVGHVVRVDGAHGVWMHHHAERDAAARCRDELVSW